MLIASVARPEEVCGCGGGFAPKVMPLIVFLNKYLLLDHENYTYEE
jgi:hypothetical protein